MLLRTVALPIRDNFSRFRRLMAAYGNLMYRFLFSLAATRMQKKNEKTGKS